MGLRDIFRRRCTGSTKTRDKVTWYSDSRPLLASHHEKDFDDLGRSPQPAPREEVTAGRISLKPSSPSAEERNISPESSSITGVTIPNFNWSKTECQQWIQAFVNSRAAVIGHQSDWLPEVIAKNYSGTGQSLYKMNKDSWNRICRVVRSSQRRHAAEAIYWHLLEIRCDEGMLDSAGVVGVKYRENLRSRALKEREHVMEKQTMKDLKQETMGLKKKKRGLKKEIKGLNKKLRKELKKSKKKLKENKKVIDGMEKTLEETKKLRGVIRARLGGRLVVEGLR